MSGADVKLTGWTDAQLKSEVEWAKWWVNQTQDMHISAKRRYTVLRAEQKRRAALSKAGAK